MWAAPATVSARTCTSRCGSTAARSTRSATCKEKSREAVSPCPGRALTSVDSRGRPLLLRTVRLPTMGRPLFAAGSISEPEHLPEQEQVQAADERRDDRRHADRDARVREAAHHVALRREVDERDQRERDPEGEDDLAD